MKKKIEKKIKLNIVLKTIQIIRDEGLLYVANDITYKLLLSSFPMLIFLLSLMGFFTIDYTILTENIDRIIPIEVVRVMEMIASEVINIRRPNLLSISLSISLLSATAGMRRLVAGIKKAYGEEENRGFVKVYVHSFVLVLLFTLAIMLSTIGIIFGGHIINFINDILPLEMGTLLVWSYNILSVAISVCIMLYSVIIINKIALDRKVTTRQVIPGSIFTVVIWVLSSIAFNIYVHFFSDMAKVYGSVAGFAVFMIWLNIICNVMLFGAVINRELGG